MKKNLLLILILFNTLSAFSQKNYFQQKVDFNIRTELDKENNSLSSFETITYKNNSPDTLDFIYFHLWPNGYKNKKTALSKQLAARGNGDLYFKAKKNGGFIDSLDFKSGGKKLRWEYDKKHIDICKVYLDKPLLPAQTIEITTPFYVKIPKDVSRLGHGYDMYQITQWYPKPAVYDNTGWHQMPYLDFGEFYSEFGDYDVYITVPRQVVVMATGNLQNSEELAWLKKLNITKEKGASLKNPSETDKKTLHYSEKNIHDFAWFCSSEYLVTLDSLKLPNSGKTVKTWTAFTDFYKTEWEQGNKNIKTSLLYYSERLGDYPYNNCTAVEGGLEAGGGMEYPTITVISTDPDENIIMHEVGHNWFFGILGFNERRYPYLDEGLNTYYEHRYAYDNKTNSLFGYFDIKKYFDIPSEKALMNLAYLMPAFMDIDQPLNLHSTDYSSLSYGSIIYEKTPQALNYLETYMGRETFDQAMQSFYEEWKFKHPQPSDFERHIRNSTDKNLDWFFDGVVATNGKVDSKIKFKHNKIILKNKGDIAAPTVIVGYDNNNNPVDTIVVEPFEKKTKIKSSKKDYSKFVIDPTFETMDFNRYNNFTRTRGVFKRYEKLRFRIFPGFLDYKTARINILPFMYYNRISKFQIGAFIHNVQIPIKNFFFVFRPIYSFGYEKLTGSLYMQYKKTGFNGLPATTYSFYIDKVAYYTPAHDFIPNPFRKLKLQVAYNLQNKYATDKYSKQLKLSFIAFPKSVFNQKSFVFERLSNFASVLTVNFTMRKKSRLRPFSATVNMDIYAETYRLWAEAKYKIHYTSFADGLDIRVFSGSNVPVNGTFGMTDLKYEHFYWGRYRDYEAKNAKLFAHQFYDEFGGLTFYYNSPDYHFVNAINLKTTLPKVPILKFYYNFVSSGNFKNGSGLNALDVNKGLYEVGVMLDIIPNVFAIYLPVHGSKELMDYNKAIKDHWYQYYRFTFKLHNFQDITSNLPNF